MIAVTTVILGGIDTLPSHPPDDSVDWIAWMDEPVESTDWDVRHVGFSGHPRMACKRYRMLHHLLLPEYDYTIAVDGNIHVKEGAKIGEAIDLLGDSDLALFRHAERDDITQEAEASMLVAKYQGSRTLEMARDFSREVPPHSGLWWCGFVVRRNNQRVRHFMDVWYDTVHHWSDPDVVINDQIAFPWVCRMTGMLPADLPADHYPNRHIENRWTTLGPHKDVRI